MKSLFCYAKCTSYPYLPMKHFLKKKAGQTIKAYISAKTILYSFCQQIYIVNEVHKESIATCQ